MTPTIDPTLHLLGSPFTLWPHPSQCGLDFTPSPYLSSVTPSFTSWPFLFLLTFDHCLCPAPPSFTLYDPMFCSVMPPFDLLPLPLSCDPSHLLTQPFTLWDSPSFVTLSFALWPLFLTLDHCVCPVTPLFDPTVHLLGSLFYTLHLWPHLCFVTTSFFHVTPLFDIWPPPWPCDPNLHTVYPSLPVTPSIALWHLLLTPSFPCDLLFALWPLHLWPHLMGLDPFLTPFLWPLNTAFALWPHLLHWPFL